MLDGSVCGYRVKSLDRLKIDAHPEDALRAEFVRLLTTDSPHHDRRRRDYSQALFMEDGRPVWTETTLDMVMAKFDRAVRNLRRVGGGRD